MKGDILIINENHKKAAKQSVEIMLEDIKASEGKYMITVAGESGAGKSEIAASIAEGTYTTSLNNIDTHIFIDLNYIYTLEA
ncbi:MAG: hypothetical protein K8S00_01615 [Bacteroidales bacterium]|nr:hypothetical protein [Bacteroidales bacterium]